MPAPAATPNFATDDAELSVALEAARLRSAIFWTGRPLPGRWATPCPVAVTPSASDRVVSAGGTTTFRIDRGQVGGWSMRLVGPRESVLADAVPHEVDHMVRASLLRRPLPRWIDEGAAGLWESRAEHQRHRRRAAVAFRRGRDLTPLLGDRYPTASSDVADLYAVGFVLTERLLDELGPAGLLRLQSELADDDSAAQRRVEATIRSVRRHRSPVGCDEAGCLFHPLASETGTPPSSDRRLLARCVPNGTSAMTVYTASWCPPCRQFWRDLKTDAAFADALRSRVHLHVVDVGASAHSREMAGLTALPTFEIDGRRKLGYRGKANLIAAIDRLRAGTNLDTVSPRQPLPTQPPPEQSEPPREVRPLAVVEDPLSPDSPLDSPLDLPPDSSDPPPSSPSCPAPPTDTVPTSPLPSPLPSSLPSPLPAKSAPLRIGTWLITAGQLAGLGTGAGATLAVGLLGWWWSRRRGRPSRRRERRWPDASSWSPPSPLHPHDSETGSRGWSAGCFPEAGRQVSTARGDPGDGCDDAATTNASGQPERVPFPRRLDEARELLRLRQREGRVAVLDALRGMVVDDELGRLVEQPEHAATATQLREALDRRVQQIAPLSTRVD